MRSNFTANLSLKTQQYIVTIAEEGSFTRAAKQLGVDAALLSRSVEKIEKTLNAKLFDRSRHNFALTRAGRVFVEETRAALRHAERAWNLARLEAHMEKGPIRLGYSPLIHSSLLPVLRRLDVLREEWKHAQAEDGQELRITLESAGTVKLMELVLRGELHAAVGVQPVEDDDLWVRPIAREGFCVGLPRNHKLTQRPTLVAKDLHGDMVFLIPRAAHPAFYDKVTAYIEGTGAQVVFQPVLPLNQAIEFVAHGFGIALLPRSVSRFSYMGVVFKPLTDKLLEIETAIFTRRDRYSTPFLDFIHALLSRFRSSSTIQ